MTNEVATQEKPVDTAMAPSAGSWTSDEKVQEGTLARIILNGDLSGLTKRELVTYYMDMCRAVGADPLTRPFDLLELPDEKDKKKTRLVLYPNSRCASQLRANHNISIEEPKIEEKHGCVIVTIRATMVNRRTGETRTDFDSGAVPTMKAGGKRVETGGKWADGNPKTEFVPDGTMVPMEPLAVANAIKKSITQAKRRVTFSLRGLSGMVDQGDVEDGHFPGAKTIDSDALLDTGQVRAVAAPAEAGNGGSEKAAPSISVAVKKFVAARDELSKTIEAQAGAARLTHEAMKKLGEDWAVKTVGEEMAAAIREAMATGVTGYVDSEIYRVAAAMNAEAMRVRSGGPAQTAEPKQKTLA